MQDSIVAGCGHAVYGVVARGHARALPVAGVASHGNPACSSPLLKHDVATIRRDPEPSLADYGTVPISFTTTSILRIEWQNSGLDGIRITEVPIDPPLTKDFDDGEPVSRWLQFGDISRWGFFGAYDAGRRVGGAVVAHRTPTVRMLEGRTDLGVLWDIRVAPSHRQRGIGSRLLQAAARFAWDQGCATLKVESQSTNPAACRFYARHGFTLGGIRENAYPEYPDEIQLLWYLQAPGRPG